MNISQTLLGMVGIGVEGVLYSLFLLSIVCVAYVIDRLVYFYHKNVTVELLLSKFREALSTEKVDELDSLANKTKKLEAKVIASAFTYRHRGGKYVKEYINTEVSFHKNVVERGMNFLGTVGSNAPFIGLFGTVLGIIKAFHDLSQNAAGGIGVVMAGIADALIATAVGLLVAIPAVVAYNFFQAKVNNTMENIERIADLLAVEIDQMEEKLWEQEQGKTKAQ